MRLLICNAQSGGWGVGGQHVLLYILWSGNGKYVLKMNARATAPGQAAQLSVFCQLTLQQQSYPAG